MSGREADPEIATYFSPDYATARGRFRALAEARGMALESHPIEVKGPGGEALAIDVARAGAERPDGVVVVSSGLHGIEGYFGAAVQLALLGRPDVVSALPGGVALVVLHVLDPFGFAWVRRVNEDNVDLNRNFLDEGEPYRGSPSHYAKFDRLLNPMRPPRVVDPFRALALLAILRHGMPELKQAVAGGQYDFPLGLFFGGHAPSPTYRILAEHLSRWVGDAANVLHVDFHTGLGRWATYQLLLDDGLGPGRFEWLRGRFGDPVRHSRPDESIAYEARGSLGTWCRSSFPGRAYDLLCAEFGTYPPLRVLSALRAENRAHLWGEPDDPATRRAKRRFMETFVPSSPRWRARCVWQGLEVVARAVEACRDRPDRP
jgi:hypothetical protein